MLPMSERLNSIDWDTRMGIQAWMYSLTIHAMLVGLALLLGARLMVATPEEPFHWNVALVEHAPVTEAVTPAPPVTPVQPPAKPVQQTPKKVQPAPQPTPVERRIETTVQPIVQQMQTKPQEQILERKIETREHSSAHGAKDGDSSLDTRAHPGCDTGSVSRRDLHRSSRPAPRQGNISSKLAQYNRRQKSCSARKSVKSPPQSLNGRRLL